MGINHRGLDIAMAPKHLHRSDAVTSFEQMGGKGMPEGVASGPLHFICRRHCIFVSTRRSLSRKKRIQNFFNIILIKKRLIFWSLRSDSPGSFFGGFCGARLRNNGLFQRGEMAE